MLLQAPNQRVKDKWLQALVIDSDARQGFSTDCADLVTEGYILKIQPFGNVSKTRWFRVNTKKFSYHTDEAGEEMGCVPLLTCVGFAWSCQTLTLLDAWSCQTLILMAVLGCTDLCHMTTLRRSVWSGSETFRSQARSRLQNRARTKCGADVRARRCGTNGSQHFVRC